MINPVVDPVPRTDHRVATTVLYDAMLPQLPTRIGGTIPTEPHFDVGHGHPSHRAVVIHLMFTGGQGIAKALIDVIRKRR